MKTLLLLAALAAAAPPGDERVDATTEALASEPALIPGLPPGTPPPATEVDAVAQAIGQGLRCPVCQGLSVADSTSNAAVMMQRRIRELVAAGYSRQEIEDFFVGKYGEWVLLAPPNQGMNRIVWIGPALAAAIGLIIAGTFVRGGSSAPPPSPSPAARPDDPYKARLLSEVEDD